MKFHVHITKSKSSSKYVLEITKYFGKIIVMQNISQNIIRHKMKLKRKVNLEKLIYKETENNHFVRDLRLQLVCRLQIYSKLIYSKNFWNSLS